MIEHQTAEKDTSKAALATKRLLDIFLSALALVVISPFVTILGGILAVFHGRPVVFSQTRLGLRSEPFTIRKFRTMTDDRDQTGSLLSDDDRLTPLGSVLRRWSIDELPELWNVFCGEMSLVGPRPLLVEYLPLYDEWHMRRHEVRPGMTGLAQVSGRNNQTWEERLALDVWYVDHWSLWLDTKILGRTIAKVLIGEGVSSPGEATMGRFDGTHHE